MLSLVKSYKTPEIRNAILVYLQHAHSDYKLKPKMKKRSFLFCLVFMVTTITNAQVTFQTTYTAPGFNWNTCFSSAATSDSGYIMTGAFVNMGNSDACITKTDFGGTVEWSASIGEFRAENIFAVTETANGGYVIAGTSRSFSVDSLNELYVLQLSAAGVKVWEKMYGSLSGTYETGAHSISQTADGGFIIGGYESTLMGMLYLKTDVAGAFSWGKFIYGSIGSYGVESIHQTPDGGYIMTGNGGHLIKTDAAGNITWSKTYITGELSVAAQRTNDGGYMLAGETSVYGAGGSDIYLIKTDSAGTVLWSKTYGGPLDENLRSAKQTTDGGYILGGITSSFGAVNSDMYMIKTDPAGNLVWSKTYGGSGTDFGSTVGESPAGEFYMSGYTNSFGNGTFAAYLVKTDSSGTSNCNESAPATVVTSPSINAVTVSESATAFTPDVFTPVSYVNGGFSASALCYTATSTAEVPSNTRGAISIAPNPVVNDFTISFKNPISKGRIEIQNSLGQLLLTAPIIDKSQMDIHLENSVQGLYFVKVYDGETIYSKLLIAEQY